MAALNERHMDRDRTVSAGSGVAVTPHDSNDLAAVTRGLYVGGAGNLELLLERDTSAVVLVGVIAGSLLPLRVKRVLASSTTATSIVALY